MWKFVVRPDDGEKFEVVATSRDVKKWEQTNRGSSYAGLMRDLRLTELYKIAHLASHRQGLFTGTLKDFEDNCDLSVQEEDEPDPTQPAQ